MELKQLNYILKFLNDLARQLINKITDIGKKNHQTLVADVDIMLKELQGIMKNYGNDIQQAIDKKEITLEPVQEAIMSLQSAIKEIKFPSKVGFPKMPEIKFPEIPKFPNDISIKEANEIIDVLTQVVKEIQEKNLNVDLTPIDKGLLRLEETIVQIMTDIGKNIGFELPLEEERVKVILPAKQVAQMGGGGGSNISQMFFKEPTIYNLTMTSSDTEYSQELPSKTKAFTIQCQGGYDVRFAFTTGKVATPTAPYMTLKSGQSYYEQNTNLTSVIIYSACSTPGQVLEIICWA